MDTPPTAEKRAPQAGARRAGMTREALLAALDGEIEPVRVGAGYQLGLLAVTLVMVLLPLVYVALIALVGWAVYWHAAHDVAILQGARGANVRGALVVYLLPIIAGVTLVAFMIKPLFARSSRRAAPFTLSRADQRLLYTFVDRLCEMVGARKPSRIDVDCDVNASASFRDGLPGLLTGQLVLTIGLPLAGGMSLRQLTGVLAHEFGHFAQGTGMRLTYVVRTINAWFARVVYERDSWDDWLVNLARGNTHVALVLFAWTVRGMIWLTRRILWVLMWLGNAVSSYMLRQMEFDADRYEARVAGSHTFESTSQRVVLLSVARNAAFNDLTAAWREKRLCDDLPRLIVSREKDMPQDLRAEVLRHVAQQRTGWFDSHPSDTDRVASAQREQADGVFRIQGPATVLFHDFAGISRRATEAFYQQSLGTEFQSRHLVTTDTVVAQTGEKRQAMESLGRFFQGLIDPRRPVFPDACRELPAREDAVIELLPQARTALLERAAAARQAAARYAQADDQAVGAMRAMTMQSLGRKVTAADLGRLNLQGAGEDGSFQSQEQRYLHQREVAQAGVKEALRVGMIRIEVMLALQARREAAARPSGGQGAYDLTEQQEDRTLAALQGLRLAADGIERIRQGYYRLGAALALVSPNDNPDNLVHMVLERARNLRRQLLETHASLARTPYPYEHTDHGATIARYALETIPGEEDIGGIYGAAETLLEAIYSLYMRLMSDLAHRAEELEKSVGLEPLAEPPEQAA